MTKLNDNRNFLYGESIRSGQYMQRPLTCVEICAGAGGQALGLSMAGFVHVAIVEYEEEY